MTRLPYSLALSLALLTGAHAVSAQHGEVQLGAVVSYGTAHSFRQGAGIVAGIALGRLVYAGARWVYQAGDTQPNDVAATPGTVSNRTQLFLTDFGLMLPVGALEIVPGVSIGAVRFTQSGGQPEHATELVITPGLSVHARIAGIVVIPEVQYHFAGSPDLMWPVARHGAVAALRAVIPIEVGRIRY